MQVWRVGLTSSPLQSLTGDRFWVPLMEVMCFCVQDRDAKTFAREESLNLQELRFAPKSFPNTDDEVCPSLDPHQTPN